ncbi:ORF6N domain-containing protein [Salmonella enterica]|nr:ORF6N domain-containing protein [Salmonella enterica]EAS0615918.1 ORF6N domain-containing protein [Salmonella enterica subsp. enterica serovar Dahomey]EHI8599522.1 ORF6N domain-containing protein [Salmonella enterica subsp. enterica serovar 51:z:1,5]ECS6901370.1 ORF6N domain-containing protein [Salmonella enterica]EHI8983722.1 ORF6N domain-containing protein [Salmonella enterica subsp. enterica serovar 51:z:1,5]
MTIQLAVESLVIVTYSNVPVITTELLAKLYETEEKHIRQNFKRNECRFIAGKHFFKVSGSELDDLRTSQRGLQISPKTRSLILWTERGAARHAKMLETDQAWEVFEKLEDCYFSQKCTPSDQKPIIQGDGRTLVIQFDKLGNIITSQEVPNNAWVCTMENFKFFLEQQGWTLINRKKIKSMTVEQLLSLK